MIEAPVDHIDIHARDHIQPVFRLPTLNLGSMVRAMTEPVHLLHHYSNTPDLLSDLEAALWMVQRDDLVDDPKLAGTDRAWRVRDRLTEQDMDDVVRAYQAGEQITYIARRYGINHWSVAKLVRERGDQLDEGRS